MGIHPADWRHMSEDKRQRLVWSGEFDRGEHWKVERVAHLTGLDPAELGSHVEAERGWEPHDVGFLHEVVVSARILLEREGCDCTELCSMGPTCPGGMLARLPGAGCWRTGAV